ncbi:hypothetical protein [Bradyrhizobium japonicum]|jgi:hypothetical protein|uniref:Transposase n=1 Tax=Bradyrhizobium japonicum TaxID=375 RepID=A0ABV2RKR2_BRAJP|nr:hypothetical protein [Bradyrhizobium japonicum]MBR0915627.1 hypothetical protein [Bradyrhizobium japonicum]MCD9110520.1 hypothetical protein [Bradyrhizobium japonicum]MCP1762289.1 hypothetical protein [Bradyrhizobium japonicum]MCP1793869.1 hypothetical protein [Bradyrhizobium japonicum]MCP1806302.1 hypothetical protein [Bradyrhizobium japonicum]
MDESEQALNQRLGALGRLRCAGNEAMLALAADAAWLQSRGRQGRMAALTLAVPVENATKPDNAQ